MTWPRKRGRRISVACSALPWRVHCSGDVNAPSAAAPQAWSRSCREIATSVRFADPAGHQIANIFFDHRRPWFVYVMQEPFRDVLWLDAGVSVVRMRPQPANAGLKKG